MPTRADEGDEERSDERPEQQAKDSLCRTTPSSNPSGHLLPPGKKEKCLHQAPFEYPAGA